MAIKVAIPSWSLDPEYGKPALSEYPQLGSECVVARVLGLDKDVFPLFSARARGNFLSASMPVLFQESGGGML
jgi:hypothetical protein